MYQVFGCPIKLRCEPGSRYENMNFSNLVFEDVCGPISIGAGTQRPAKNSPTEPAIVRNISFNNISGNVLTKQMGLDDSTFNSSGNPGELHSCIILNCVKGNVIENISFNNIKLTFGGGGTKQDAARRELPLIANEYFSLGPLPAYGLYARNVIGLTLNDVRFETATPDLRPAMILDYVTDVAITGFNVQGDEGAESVLRFIESQNVFMRAIRLLTPANVFARVEGGKNENISIDGGDLSKAEKSFVFADGAKKNSVKLRV